MVGVLTVMLTGMQQQNLEMLKIMMTQRQAAPQGGNEALLEAIKLGSALAGGKVPLEEGEGGIMELLSGLKPYIPQIVSLITGFFTQRQPQVPMVRPLINRPGMVVPKPLPPNVVPPVPEAVPSAPPTPEDAQAVVMRRIVEEIKFVLTLPVTPKSREHVINYIDAYMPDILKQAEAAPADMFAAYVVTLDPAFAGHESFFMDLHRQYIGLLEEEPGDPANPDPPGEPEGS
jgi:hypothetical protein